MTKNELYYQCEGCGYCCHGETTVSLNSEDVKRMSKYLQISSDELKENYLRESGNVVQMKIVDGHCIFYKEGCTVHPGKPWRCSQWPLHPSLLDDKSNFKIISDSCPGINKEMSYEDFCAQMKKNNEY